MCDLPRHFHLGFFALVISFFSLSSTSSGTSSSLRNMSLRGHFWSDADKSCIALMVGSATSRRSYFTYM